MMLREPSSEIYLGGFLDFKVGLVLCFVTLGMSPFSRSATGLPDRFKVS